MEEHNATCDYPMPAMRAAAIAVPFRLDMLRSAVLAARAVLADVNGGAVDDDRAETVTRVGNAFQILDMAIEDDDKLARRGIPAENTASIPFKVTILKRDWSSADKERMEELIGTSGAFQKPDWANPEFRFQVVETARKAGEAAVLDWMAIAEKYARELDQMGPEARFAAEYHSNPYEEMIRVPVDPDRSEEESAEEMERRRALHVAFADDFPIGTPDQIPAGRPDSWVDRLADEAGVVGGQGRSGGEMVATGIILLVGAALITGVIIAAWVKSWAN